jgi:hypothetical protein
MREQHHADSEASRRDVVSNLNRPHFKHNVYPGLGLLMTCTAAIVDKVHCRHCQQGNVTFVTLPDTPAAQTPYSCPTSAHCCEPPTCILLVAAG